PSPPPRPLATTSWSTSSSRSGRCEAGPDARPEPPVARPQRQSPKVPLAQTRPEEHDDTNVITSVRHADEGRCADGEFVAATRRGKKWVAGTSQLHGCRSRPVLSGTGRLDPGGEGGLPRLRGARGLSRVRAGQRGEVRHLGGHERAGTAPGAAGACAQPATGGGAVEILGLTPGRGSPDPR